MAMAIATTGSASATAQQQQQQQQQQQGVKRRRMVLLRQQSPSLLSSSRCCCWIPLLLLSLVTRTTRSFHLSSKRSPTTSFFSSSFQHPSTSATSSVDYGRYHHHRLFLPATSSVIRSDRLPSSSSNVAVPAATSSSSSMNIAKAAVAAGESLTTRQQQQQHRLNRRELVTKFLRRAAVGFCTVAALYAATVAPAHAAGAAKAAKSSSGAAAAAATATATEHLHTGQKVANFFRRFGVPDWAVLAIISALPVVELRGAVPVGIWMGLPIATVLPVCVAGNMLPIVPLLYLLRNDALKEFMSPVLKRAEKKTSELGIGSVEKQWASLAAFVGIPLPGTGAWTGAMGAFLLGMPAAVALSSIFAGVVSAGVIVTAITLAGRVGGIAALAALFLLTGIEFFRSGGKKQDFLEADPYWDQSAVPVNVYTNKAPFTGKVVSTKRIVGPKATGETCHIVIDHSGDFPYWEGQSWGVIPPGAREKDGKPHSVRLYSIASSRYGDDMTGKTGSLCVRRATYWCPELQAEDPAKKGVCSNFLCDTKPGDKVQMTGPAGKVMLLPEQDPATDYIMVATGTGIAPYRGFVRRLFVEQTPAADAYKGQAWLFLGVANSDALLYDDEWRDVKEKYPDQFRLDYALSREQTNNRGGKMYIQDKVEEYADEIFEKLENGAHIYFCGLKGMMPGIQDMLKGVAEKKGLDYDEWLKGLKKAKQWHVEVY